MPSEKKTNKLRRARKIKGNSRKHPIEECQWLPYLFMSTPVIPLKDYRDHNLRARRNLLGYDQWLGLADLFFHAMQWSYLIFSRPVFGGSVCRVVPFVGMHNIWPNHLNSCKYRVSARYLMPNIAHDFRGVLRTDQCSNTNNLHASSLRSECFFNSLGPGCSHWKFICRAT